MFLVEILGSMTYDLWTFLARREANLLVLYFSCLQVFFFTTVLSIDIRRMELSDLHRQARAGAGLVHGTPSGALFVSVMHT